ncbi:MAG: tRNA uridine-5-carboxymethylaminomethyl(34) synthesis GTPase MnmE [Waddliaceae bacterium]
MTKNAYYPNETVAAIATPPGEGGVAIVRISGENAIAVAGRIFSKDVHTFDSHKLYFGKVIDEQGASVDEALLVVMRGKRSYCGEDTVEIHCHGGGLISRRVLEVAFKAGAKPAKPGEFTFKAYINGKIDLAQAEAVQELIHAKNTHALDAAETHLQGRLSEKIRGFQHGLTDVAAILEAWVDFPEEGLEFATAQEIIDLLSNVKGEMDALHETFHDGKIAHDGLTLCLVGAPNVGKSSLMNALLDKERAIVTDVPGTTRDLLEDHLRIGGLNIRLIDTAGIREASEIVEMEGIRRTRSAMSEADVILVVLDVSREVSKEEYQLISELPKDRTLVIWNKIDLAETALPELSLAQVKVSAKEKRGLDRLHQELDRLIWKEGPPSKDQVMITSLRHHHALQDAIESCNRVISGLQSEASPELVSIDMRHTLQNLGTIIGTDVTEDVLSAIFSKFCIGK